MFPYTLLKKASFIAVVRFVALFISPEGKQKWFTTGFVAYRKGYFVMTPPGYH